jgi:hypothetical protein
MHYFEVCEKHYEVTGSVPSVGTLKTVMTPQNVRGSCVTIGKVKA